MNEKPGQVSNETFWLIFWSYVFAINSISCIVYTISIFNDWFNTPLSILLLLSTIGYSLFVYFLLSSTVILLSAWKKKGLRNLDKINDHGIIWYLGFFLIWSFIMAVIMFLLISGTATIFDFTVIRDLIKYSSFVLLYMGPAFMFIGFIVGTIFGLIYEFREK